MEPGFDRMGGADADAYRCKCFQRVFLFFGQKREKFGFRRHVGYFQGRKKALDMKTKTSQCFILFGKSLCRKFIVFTFFTLHGHSSGIVYYIRSFFVDPVQLGLRYVLGVQSLNGTVSWCQFCL